LYWTDCRSKDGKFQIIGARIGNPYLEKYEAFFEKLPILFKKIGIIQSILKNLIDIFDEIIASYFGSFG